MKKEKTLIVIKPDGVERKLVGEALKRFEKIGLDLVHLEIKKVKRPTAKKFYSHLEKKVHPKIFKSIINYFSSNKVVIGMLEGKNAAKRVRDLCGPTNPKAAPKGTIRGDFGIDDLIISTKEKRAIKNIIHSSETYKHAKKEFKILQE